MNIFVEIEYRRILRQLVLDRKKTDSAMNFQSLAHAMRIQKPYLSKVLKGDADLNFDQLFLACQFLGLSETEHEYLELLLDHSRTSLESRRKKLERKIRRVQQARLKTSEHLASGKFISDGRDLQDYYLNPIHQLIHMAMMIPRFQASPQRICEEFPTVSRAALAKCLRNLEHLQLITEEGGQYKTVKDNLHLPKDSPLFSTHHTLVRVLSLQQFQSSGKIPPFQTSVTFTAGEKEFLVIQQKYIEFLKAIESVVGSAPSQDVFQMNFDLFSWSSK